MKKNSIGTVLFRALHKYGIDGFKLEIICICFDEDCNRYEKDYIKRYNTMTPSGYNMQDGGKNPSITCRKKIVLSDEQKEKRKGVCVREKNGNFQKTTSDEQKKKISESLKKYAKNHPREPRKRKTPPFCREIEQYDENNLLIATFKSLSDAARSIKTNYNVIHKYVKDGTLYRGFYWKAGKEVSYHCLLTPFLASNACRKKVFQYDLQDRFIAEHVSLSEAARSVSGNVTTLSRCASDDPKHKRNKTHKGFIWKFEAPEPSEPPKKKTKSSRAYKSFLRNPDGSIATLC